MQFLIVTGLSGSGKSSVMNILEDIGFYCIDNMPPQLILKFIELCRDGDMEKIAIAVDIRSGDTFTTEISASLEKMRRQNFGFKLVYIDADDSVLLKRYKETRRKHPLDAECGGSLETAISFEREKLNCLREIADYFIDTSAMKNAQLKEYISDLFLEKATDSIFIKVMSFGFKYGSNTEADLVFDVRCLPNPFYLPDLKPLTGLDQPVRDYVMKFEQSDILMDKLKDLLDFLVPQYIHEGKSQLVIAFGCTGGKHRSVTFAELISKYLSEKDYNVHTVHRDILKS